MMAPVFGFPPRHCLICCTYWKCFQGIYFSPVLWDIILQAPIVLSIQCLYSLLLWLAGLRLTPSVSPPLLKARKTVFIKSDQLFVHKRKAIALLFVSQSELIADSCHMWDTIDVLFCLEVDIPVTLSVSRPGHQ